MEDNDSHIVPPSRRSSRQLIGSASALPKFSTTGTATTKHCEDCNKALLQEATAETVSPTATILANPVEPSRPQPCPYCEAVRLNPGTCSTPWFSAEVAALEPSQGTPARRIRTWGRTCGLRHQPPYAQSLENGHRRPVDTCPFPSPAPVPEQ